MKISNLPYTELATERLEGGGLTDVVKGILDNPPETAEDFGGLVGVIVPFELPVDIQGLLASAG